MPHSLSRGAHPSAVAVRKRHSTAQEAVDCAAAMKARFLIMNHFSQVRREGPLGPAASVRLTAPAALPKDPRL